MPADDRDRTLELTTLQLINRVSYGSTTRAHSRRVRAVTGLDLSPSDIRALEFLAGRDPLPLSAVATELGIDLAQASRQATALEELGHVVRATDPADRRRTLISLSASTSELMDRWLLDWSSGFLVVLDEWSPADVKQLTRWLDLVLRQLEDALPNRMVSTVPARWQKLMPADQHDPVMRDFVGALIALISWVGQSGGFNDILEALGAPVRQHTYFTLRMVSRHGPMSIADVAERMGIDPSQASKRLRQLTDLGLVDHAVDALDRRSKRVRVSRKGATLERKVRESQLATFIDILGNLPETDRKRWNLLMTRFMARLDEVAAESDRWAGVTAAGLVSR